MKDKFEEILQSHGIYGEDIEEILYAVSDMLEYAAKQTRKEAPYAVTSIKKLEDAAYQVFDLGNELE